MALKTVPKLECSASWFHGISPDKSASIRQLHWDCHLDEKRALVPCGSRTRAYHPPDTINSGLCRM